MTIILSQSSQSIFLSVGSILTPSPTPHPHHGFFTSTASSKETGPQGPQAAEEGLRGNCEGLRGSWEASLGILGASKAAESTSKAPERASEAAKRVLEGAGKASEAARKRWGRDRGTEKKKERKLSVSPYGTWQMAMCDGHRPLRVTGPLPRAFSASTVFQVDLKSFFVCSDIPMVYWRDLCQKAGHSFGVDRKQNRR